ncbi:unnamed protein product [Cladocopium goreaui]|uniref:UDP-Gal betaGal beta 1,3-galactosyltransferase, polypeptide 6 n=1 Tax=Cladocopium goreaui TaxID=2562237 RepID=A0A9P1FV01_9DINO|nr:unnamed protein product [Cladocopium goreaui]
MRCLLLTLIKVEAGCDFNVTSEREGRGHVSRDGGVTCEVAWSAWSAWSPDIEADLVFTDDLQQVPFAARHGNRVFLERLEMPRLGEAMDSILQMKDHLLSVLLPREGSIAWEDPQTRVIADQVMQVIPKHVYVDEGSLSSLEDAFRAYRFSLIVDDERSVSQALIHSIAWGSIPLFNGFSHLLAMLPRVVFPWNRSHFRIDQLLNFLPEINEEIGSLWQQHRLLQDQLLYRYATDFQSTLKAFSCTLCETMVAKPGKSTAKGRSSIPTIFVGVYSASGNFEKREVVRGTWGRIFQKRGFRVKFFLGQPPETLAREVKSESHEHQDLVLLDVQEGYQWNSLKGLRFLEWCSSNVLAEFLVKVDDDVYLRPLPLISLLEHRPPAGYVWGYFDFFSPVPREEGQAFYNSEATYPFDAFPPYARGLVRALSMDVVHGLATLSREGKLPVISGDDPCFGVHLRYLRDDPRMIPRMTLDDRDSYRVFAMEPSCNPGLWSHVTPRSWVIHHVSPEQVQCMWDADVEAGLYQVSGSTVELPMVAQRAAQQAASFATVAEMQEPPAFPDLCQCLQSGPLAAELAGRQDKINASRTFMMWGHPSLLDQEDS